jgi:rhamnogalacturonyl hydrolase YesR
VEGHDYKGYEPFDGLSSAFRPLTFGNLFLERLLQQLVRQSPVNLRPLLGVTRKESTKGRGYMAWGYLEMLKSTGDRAYREKAVDTLDWVVRHKSPFYENCSWGNHFDFSSRQGKLPAHEPIIVWSSLIGQAFLDAYDLLGDENYLKVARSICSWILDLPREKTDSGTCISYVAFSQESIHNSNMLGAAMLSRTAKYGNGGAYLDAAKAAMEYSCSRQLGDGAWYYGEDPKNHWIDNFHTGYNLDSLKCYIESTGDRSYDANLRKGFDYFKRVFFEAEGLPKYYHNRAYPIDIQCASQAITTLAHFADYDEASLALSERVAKWTIANMQDKEGYFYYRKLPWIRAKTPMLHWGQATMYKGLTLLYSRMSR